MDTLKTKSKYTAAVVNIQLQLYIYSFRIFKKVQLQPLKQVNFKLTDTAVFFKLKLFFFKKTAAAVYLPLKL